MRQQYTPIFRSILTSRVWALSPAHRCVWMWLQLHADPEGYVCADVTGVAMGARVTGTEAREALELLALPDADAEPDDPHEGRIIERVSKGWRVLDYEASRELAKREARNARNRRYMRTARAKGPANDTEAAAVEALVELTTEPSDTGVPCGPNVAPPKPKPKSKPKTISEDGDSPLPPGMFACVSCGRIESAHGPCECGSRTFQNPPVHDDQTGSITLHRVQHTFPATWQPSQSLRDDATMAGVTDFDDRLASLRTGPIGGTRGVLEGELDNYVRSFFGKWRTWAETDRAKTIAAQQKPASGPWRGGVVRAVIEPTSKHRSYAKKHGLPLDELVREMVESGAAEELGAKRALELLGTKMSKLVQDRRGPQEAA